MINKKNALTLIGLIIEIETFQNWPIHKGSSWNIAKNFIFLNLHLNSRLNEYTNHNKKSLYKLCLINNLIKTEVQRRFFDDFVIGPLYTTPQFTWRSVANQFGVGCLKLYPCQGQWTIDTGFQLEFFTGRNFRSWFWKVYRNCTSKISTAEELYSQYIVWLNWIMIWLNL